MAKIRRIDFSPDEWIAGCLGLSVEEEGLYIRICALIWSRGGRITDDLLKASCLAHGNKVNALLASLERKGKIVRNGSEIGQKRAENELEKAEERHRNASENANKRWKTNGLVNAEASHPSIANHQPSTPNNSVPNGTAQDAPQVDFTKDLFDLGVRVFTARGIPERKARTLIGQGRKNLHDDGRLLAIMLSIDREAPVDPIGYFEAAIKPKPLQGWGAPGLA